MIRTLLIQLFCLTRLDMHDTGTKRTGLCRRCHLYVNENGRTQR